MSFHLDCEMPFLNFLPIFCFIFSIFKASAWCPCRHIVVKKKQMIYFNIQYLFQFISATRLNLATFAIDPNPNITHHNPSSPKLTRWTHQTKPTSSCCWISERLLADSLDICPAAVDVRHPSLQSWALSVFF